MSAHQRLREATRAAHDRVDSAFSTYNLSTREDYSRFLVRHAAAFVPAEEALTRAGATDLIDGWDQLRRAPLLLADLAGLGLTIPDPISPPGFTTPASVLGGAYVLEGSRLGGALLRKQVGADMPRSYLDSVQPPGRWRDFVAELNRLLYDQEQLDEAIESALRVFAMFDSSKRNSGVVDSSERDGSKSGS